MSATEGCQSCPVRAALSSRRMSDTASAPLTEAAVLTSGISLVLGSGGARGYAHIGVIEELLVQGFHIESIAGSSMGALDRRRVCGRQARPVPELGRLDAEVRRVAHARLDAVRRRLHQG